MDPAPPLQPIDQDDVFYIAPWERHIETYVLQNIFDDKERGLWVYGDDAGNRRCLEGIRQAMERSHQLSIPLEGYVAKLHEWQTRYENFLMLLDMYWVVHDLFDNTLHASERTWRLIQAARPDLMCYYNEGEVNWAYLKAIFRPPPHDTSSDSYGSDVSLDSPTSIGSPEYPPIIPWT